MNVRAETWLVTVESFERLTTSTRALQLVAEALDAGRAASGAAASLDSERGVLSATFDVVAPTQGAAADAAIAAFYEALSAAGLEVERPGRKLKLEIEPSAEVAPA